jgi:hypothetical protein
MDFSLFLIICGLILVAIFIIESVQSFSFKIKDLKKIG